MRTQSIAIYKFISLGPRGFRDDFLKFSHVKSMGAKTLWHDQLGPQKYSWQDLCSVPIDTATY